MAEVLAIMLGIVAFLYLFGEFTARDIALMRSVVGRSSAKADMTQNNI